MEIVKTAEGTGLTIALEGRLDSISSRDLEKELRASVPGLTELVFEFEKLSYITSAGLRVIMSAQKVMMEQGKMRLINVSNDIMDIMDMVGLTDVFTIE